MPVSARHPECRPGSGVHAGTAHGGVLREQAYVLSFSEALWRELKGRDVRVTVLCPGLVESEFQARAGLATAKLPQLLAVSAERVAEEGYRGLMAGRRLVVPGLLNKVITRLARLAPRALMIEAVNASQRRRGE